MKGDDNRFPSREDYSLEISADGMTAVAHFLAPLAVITKMTARELKEDLRRKGIRYGICEENILHFFEGGGDRELVVAQGKPYRMSKPGKVEYMFPTDRKAKPTVRKDGSVDFHKLNTICPCKKGDLLARLIPADPGEKGYNVYGEEFAPPNVKEERLEFGKNISISEDRLSIYSKVNGHVTLVGKEVFVTNLLELENVDVSTGDVEYDGSVLITGNVFSGYTVKATGDIEIRGVVEGTRVESGGNISIARGMNGMSKGVLVAKGHVVCKYLENAEVSAEEYVSAEAILHSHVYAGTEILVSGRKGFIAGGKVMASNRVAVKTLGSGMGAATTVVVGINPKLKKRQSHLLQQMQEAKKYIANIEPVIMAMIQKKQKNAAVSDEQINTLRKLAIARQKKKKELENIYRELDELDEIMEESKAPVVEVAGEVYPGTKICILDVSMVVQSNIKYCKFFRSEGEVKMTALS